MALNRKLMIVCKILFFMKISEIENLSITKPICDKKE